MYRSITRAAARYGRRVAPQVVALLALGGVAGAQTSGTLAGTVTDAATGAPIAAARVVADGAGAITAQDGSFRIRLAPGVRQVSVSALGFASVREAVTIRAGETVSHAFRLSQAAVELEGLVVVGSRSARRTVTSAPVPVDVVTAEAIQRTGLTETSQIIQRLAPSFNFPRPSVTDGTDHVRPATLRGLAPDQILVLVNGKRRHSTALVNVNGTIGRGSTSVDLNAIPASAIERIEILRDGAAAQYGSDAIAGVLNIVLKSGVAGGASTSVGQTRVGDGRVVQASAYRGVSLAGGTLTLAAEFRDREGTNRAGTDARQQYFSGDPRNAEAEPRVTHRFGDADTRDGGAFLNLSLPLGEGVEVYGFGGLTHRAGESAGFFRRALDDRTVRAIYPDGYLPKIGSVVRDGSAALGVKGESAGWRWDLSSAYGNNSFRFDVRNSVNVSLGTASPTEFYAGTLGFDQWTTNLDLARELRPGGVPLNVALGAEYRREGYRIGAGEEASYADGGARILDGPNRGQLAAVGAQVFPGFRPADEVDASRGNVAAYLDLEVTPTSGLLVALAGRVERYDDFGATRDGKIAARYEPVRGLALRGAAGTGFRAPSLAQSHYSSTSTSFINGVPYDIRTFPVQSPEAKILGARALRPERSVNLSGGVALEPFRGAALTVDLYRIDIDDRIVFSGNFVGADIRRLFESQGLRGVGGGRFFTNAIDTRTRGVDVVGSYGARLGGAGLLRLTAGFNHNRSEVVRVAETPAQLAGKQETLFDRVERGRIEEGQPRTNLNLTASYSLDRLTLNLHNQRFGEVTSRGTAADGSRDQTFAPRWVTDLDLSYRVAPAVTLAAGANNLFDVYPDRWRDVEQRGPLSNSGIFPYSNLSPFGFNGAYYYLRVSVTR